MRVDRWCVWGGTLGGTLVGRTRSAGRGAERLGKPSRLVTHPGLEHGRCGEGVRGHGGIGSSKENSLFKKIGRTRGEKVPWTVRLTRSAPHGTVRGAEQKRQKLIMSGVLPTDKCKAEFAILREKRAYKFITFKIDATGTMTDVCDVCPVSVSANNACDGRVRRAHPRPTRFFGATHR